MKSLCWIRRDLRTSDHAALSHALESYNKVAVVFVFDTNILDQLKDKKDKRITFIHHSIQEVNQFLKERGSQLIVLYGDPVKEIPKLAKNLGVNTVLTNRDYEPYAVKRDKEVQRLLKDQGQDLHTFKDHVIFEKDEIFTEKGAYKVFTPYKNAWMKRLLKDDSLSYSMNWKSLWPAKELEGLSHSYSFEDLGFQESELWLKPGEKAAKERLIDFLKVLPNYNIDRDFPALEHTSGLSAHFRFGTMSIREAVRTCFKHRSPGAQTWLNEIIWREFYQMILWNFPHVVTKSFKPEYENLDWHGEPDHFRAWCEGQTGYPIVDAAMRCLNIRGWMHNRLRMVTASFLTKDLLIDWRKGEDYFAEKLIDHELASNNGGWQWCASTGVDAQPSFRIFNPLLQSKKFDSKGDFIRKWCPELKGFDNILIHNPWEATIMQQEMANCILGTDYPHPIVEHKEQKEKALELLKSYSKNSL